MTSILRARSVAFAYGDTPVFENVDFDLSPTELVMLIGPNGAGKTTLLHVLLGILEPTAGSVVLSGASLAELERVEIARKIAFVPQDVRSDFAFTVRELVSMGRTPYLGRFRPEGPGDVEAVDRALAATETGALSNRFASDLSGGERQRVHLARALAQETNILLLDEPTANLDVAHQLQILGLVQKLTKAGRSAVVALHDLSLAARYADRVVVLARGGIALSGPPRDVITEETLRLYFGIRARVVCDESDGMITVVPLEPMP
jgi:iron complex transport system ATP-binding protein